MAGIHFRILQLCSWVTVLQFSACYAASFVPAGTSDLEVDVHGALMRRERSPSHSRHEKRPSRPSADPENGDKIAGKAAKETVDASTDKADKAAADAAADKDLKDGTHKAVDAAVDKVAGEAAQKESDKEAADAADQAARTVAKEVADQRANNSNKSIARNASNTSASNSTSNSTGNSSTLNSTNATDTPTSNATNTTNNSTTNSTPDASTNSTPNASASATTNSTSNATATNASFNASDRNSSKSVNKSVDAAADKTAEEEASKEAEKAADAAADKVAAKQAQKKVGEAVDDAADKEADEEADKEADKAASKAADQVAKEVEPAATKAPPHHKDHNGKQKDHHESTAKHKGTPGGKHLKTKANGNAPPKTPKKTDGGEVDAKAANSKDEVQEGAGAKVRGNNKTTEDDSTADTGAGAKEANAANDADADKIDADENGGVKGQGKNSTKTGTVPDSTKTSTNPAAGAGNKVDGQPAEESTNTAPKAGKAASTTTQTPTASPLYPYGKSGPASFVKWEKYPTKCLSAGSSSEDGTTDHSMVMWDCEDVSNEGNLKFRMPQPNKRGQIQLDEDPSKCATVFKGWHGNGVKINLEKCKHPGDKLFHSSVFLHLKKGTSSILRWGSDPYVEPTKLVDIDEESTDNGAKVEIWDLGATTSWLIEQAKDDDIADAATDADDATSADIADAATDTDDASSAFLRLDGSASRVT